MAGNLTPLDALALLAFYDVNREKLMEEEHQKILGLARSEINKWGANTIRQLKGEKLTDNQ